MLPHFYTHGPTGYIPSSYGPPTHGQSTHRGRTQSGMDVRRYPYEEVEVEFRGRVDPRDLPFPTGDGRSSGNPGGARSRASRYTEDESMYSQNERRQRPRTPSRVSKNNEYDPSYLNDLASRAERKNARGVSVYERLSMMDPDEELLDDRRARSRASTRRSEYERGDRRAKSRASTRQTETEYSNRRARSKASTRKSGYEREDRRGKSRAPTWESTIYSTEAANDTDYDRLSRPAFSRASARQSTIYPNDSISQGGYHPRRHRERELETRGRSRGPANDRRQRYIDDYPSTVPSKRSSRSVHRPASSRQRSPSVTHAFALDALDPRPTWTYVPATRKSDSSVTHPHGRNALDNNPVYTTQSRRSRASEAPYDRSSASRRQSVAPSGSRRDPPPPPWIQGGLSGGYQAQTYELPGPMMSDSDVEIEQLRARMRRL